MWMFTAVVFVVATGVGYLMGVTYGRFRYVRVEKERDMANERVFQLEADLRTLKGDAEALRSAIDAMHEDARHTSDALAAERERVFELEAQLVDQEARHAESERLKRKASMEKMERESARSWVMSLGADDKRLLRRLAQGPLTTTFLDRSSFDATVRGVRRGVEFTEVDRDFHRQRGFVQACAQRLRETRCRGRSRAARIGERRRPGVARTTVTFMR